jgi:7,8-dihydroneopterin 2',3'-cyclic phosphate phosphodiesterase
MKQLIELANKIKDNDLRKKVVEFLKDPTLSHKGFKKYPMEKIEKVKTPFAVSGSAPVERGDLIKHTITVTDLCLKTAETMEKEYKIPINKDNLVAGAILHDIMKIYEWKAGKDGVEHTGIMLDHSFLGVAELYHRGFPEGVIHVIAAHYGEHGPTPPRNFEALILHHIDTLVSLTEYHYYGNVKTTKEIPQLLLLDEETIRKMIGEKTEKKPE